MTLLERITDSLGIDLVIDDSKPGYRRAAAFHGILPMLSPPDKTSLIVLFSYILVGIIRESEYLLSDARPRSITNLLSASLLRV